MTSLISTSLVRHASALVAAALFAAGAIYGQSNASDGSSSAPGYSSSQAGVNQVQLAELAAPALPGGSAASASGASGGQYGSSGGHGFHGIFHHWTFEAGVGANAPTGSDIPYITWGGNFTLGGGLRFNKRFSLLGEYQFMDDKLPGPFISAFSADGVTAGNSHINSITASPVLDITPKRSNGVYAVGGAGWYHKSTNLQSPQPSFNYYYGYIYQNVTVASFTSNQWGVNGGLGLYHRFGNIYGDTSHTEVFAEARYLYIHTPPITQSNGLGITELIPFQLGLRF